MTPRARITVAWIGATTAAAMFATPQAPARAADASSAWGALALAALVSENAPTIAAGDKQILAALLAGNAGVSAPKGKKITVAADKVVCSVSNVDITHHACTLTFGGKTANLSGRKAHELFATLVEVGVQQDGAAGTIYEGVSQLTCSVDLDAVKQRAGEGATCQFTPGAV